MLILCASSKATPLLINTPFSAPLPVLTIIAVGVANPSAQGQAITSTEINILRENSRFSLPIKYQASAANTERTITIGTKYPEIISASLAIGAFVP